MTFQEKTTAFMDSLRQRPGTNINLNVYIADLRGNNAGGGIGIDLSSLILSSYTANRVQVAAQDIAKDDELFSVSKSAIFTGQDSSLYRQHPDPSQDLDSWHSLVLVMISKMVKGKSLCGGHA